MGLYEFKPEDAFNFAHHVHIQAKQRGKELWFLTCPFCHGTGKSNQDKFSINLNTGQFKCFRSSCGRTGNMIDLAREFDFSLGNEFDEYYQPKKKYRTFTTPKEPIKPKPKAIEYLNSRGISETIAAKYEVTVRTDQPNVLAFPFYDEHKTLTFVKYRKTDYNKDRDSSKEWCEADSKPILFGMNHCNYNNPTLVITEGQLDSLSLAEAGVENAVSVPMGVNNFNWVPYCWNWVNQFEKIIVFGDHEKGRITLVEDIRKRFKKQIYNVRPEDYKDCKDANDILRKYGAVYLKDCVENAVPVKIDNLINLADVEDDNAYDAEALKTGIKDLDDFLIGGFRFPGMVIITGKRGEGKSTLASQIMCDAVDQGYRVMVYTGELPAKRFKSTFVRQLAGTHCFKYQTAKGYEGYEVSQSFKSSINAWVDGNVFLYDNNTIGEGNDLLETVEKAITQYGVRVILLDNLMTALSLTNVSNDNKFDAQGDFTQKVANMAQKYNVIIFLVAHKRKNSTYDEMDDISGTSDISNLAIGAISYSRDKELDVSQRSLKLLKDRTFGRYYTSGWTMHFDEKSDRIYGEHDNKEREYGWYKEPEDFTDIADLEVPFE